MIDYRSPTLREAVYRTYGGIPREIEGRIPAWFAQQEYVRLTNWHVLVCRLETQPDIAIILAMPDDEKTRISAWGYRTVTRITINKGAAKLTVRYQHGHPRTFIFENTRIRFEEVD